MSKIEVHKVSTLTGHRDCIYSLEQADATNFFSAGGDGMVVKWDLENPEIGKLVVKVEQSVYAVHYLANSEELLVAENFQGIHKIDLRSKKENQSTNIGASSFFDIKSYKDKILVAGGDGTLIVLAMQDLSTIAKIRLSEKSARCLEVNEQTEELVVGYSDSSFRIFSLIDFKLIRSVPAHENSIFTLAYSKDKKFLLTAGRDAHLKIWDVQNNYQLKESIAAHMYAINHIAFSPDAQYFATCSMDKSVKIWDATTFKLLKVIDKARHAGHGTSVNKLFWSSYHGQLISCSDDRSISIWNLDFGLKIV